MRQKLACHTFLGAVAFLAFLTSQAEAQIDAFAGKPFGVGRIVIRVPEGQLPQPLGADGITVTEESGRVFYPVVETPPDTTVVKKILFDSPLLKGGPVRQQVGGLIQGILDQKPPTTIYFLFTGNEPLRLTIGTKVPQQRLVQPLPNKMARDHLARDWWKQYTARPQTIFGIKKFDYPPMLRSYLESMLAARLRLHLPPVSEKDPTQVMLEEQLGLMLGTEVIQTAMIRERMMGKAPLLERADLPLPVAKEWPPLGKLEVKEGVKIEPIAMRVPEECFYIRFGNYGNFLWLQDTMKRWGGDAGNLVSLRGLDYETSKRMEDQLIVKQTTLGRMLGGTLISDVAMIGTDLFLREGASFGLLFEARNTFLLSREFATQRAERIKAGGVTEDTITIEGKKVSFIHSEDDKVRSFYLADNGYILITSSKEVMRKFIVTGQKLPKGALGVTDEFRHARTVMPTSREDTVFAYFSDAFFRNMAGPHYWIEVRRRLQAAADIEILQMARFAGAGEGVPMWQAAPSSEGETQNEAEAHAILVDEIKQLKQLQLLPKHFGRRPDGSETVFDSQGQLVDSVRGRRGFFVPVPDVPVEKITVAEATAYHRFLEFYHEKWGRLDPMIVGIRRDDLGGGQDRITIDAQANPFSKTHFETLRHRIGAAKYQKLAPIPGNIIDFQVVLPDQYVFAGLQDVQLPSLATASSASPNGSTPPQPRVGLLDMFVGYVGTTGELGLLHLLQAMVVPAERMPGLQEKVAEPQMHRLDSGKFTLFSFQQWLLDQVRPLLQFVKAEPAQFRLNVGDVAKAKITPTLNRLSYIRTRTTSLGNLRLLHSLHQQLRVPEADCLSAAETLLDAKLICPLGGKYKLVTPKTRPDVTPQPRWTSTALEATPAGSALDIPVPKDYVGPPLNWFRGLKMDATMLPEVFSAHVELIMELPK